MPKIARMPDCADADAEQDGEDEGFEICLTCPANF